MRHIDVIDNVPVLTERKTSPQCEHFPHTFMKRFLPVLILATFVVALFPVQSLALEGIGPRVTVSGTVLEVQMTKQQAFDKVGATLVLKAANGQIVTVEVTKGTEITSEGRLSRKTLIPANITAGMQVRARGWRTSTSSISAALVIILNVEVNPTLSASGTIEAIGSDSVSIRSNDNQVRTFRITNESEVNVSYTITGASGLSLIGKNAMLTLNPLDATMIRILRVTGDPQPAPTIKPPSIR